MELPRLQKLHEEFARSGLSVIAVETSGDEEKSKELIARSKLTFHCLREGKEEFVIPTLRITEFPGTLIIDRNGKIVFFQGGFKEKDEGRFREMVVSLL